VREHIAATGTIDFVPEMQTITASYEAGTTEDIQMHDGSNLLLHKLANDWNPNDRLSAINAVKHAQQRGEFLTGLLYLDEQTNDLHEILGTTEKPLNTLHEAALCPGSNALDALNKSLR
jgi:2-oxoglutarate ferredoxin oxidoreductase subunit beta